MKKIKHFWKNANIERKILVGIAIFAVIGVSATVATAQLGSSPAPALVEEDAPEILSAAGAQEIAIAYVGGGVMSDLVLNVDDDAFEIIIDKDGDVFEVIIDRATAEVVNFVSLTSEAATESAPATATTTTSGEISSDEAVEIARRHLESIGLGGATFAYVYADTDDGIAVWSIEFRYGGRDLEFYVARQGGNLIKAPQGTSNAPARVPASAASSAPAPTAPASTPAPAETAPATSEISRDRAAEIALALVPGGQLIEVDHDFERGVAVWYVAIREGGRVHAVYVNRANGNVVYQESWSE